MATHKLTIGVLVILLIAGSAGASASTPDPRGALSIVGPGPGRLPTYAPMSMPGLGEWQPPYSARTHRPGVQELAQEIPAWQQANSSGFGNAQTGEVSAVEAFDGYLYAGIHSDANDALIYRSPDGVTWTPVIQPGFGISHDIAPRAILDFIVFKNRLYTSTGRGGDPGQIYRTLDGAWGTWAPMVIYGFGDQDNVDITTLAVYNGKIYAGVRNSVTGAQIWRSDTGDNNTWTQVAPALPGTAAASVTGFAEFGGALYAAVEPDAPAQIWRSYGGAKDTWTTVVSDGFGSSLTTSTGGMAEFGGYLYVGAGNTETGAQLWRSSDGETWQQAISTGFGDSNNQRVEMVFVFQNQLYVGVKNGVTGIEIWRSTDGSFWEQANQDGFGDSNNSGSNRSCATADFLNHLYVGTANVVDGGELWRMQGSPLTYTDLSIVKRREGSGAVVAGKGITYTITLTNAGPAAPITATVIDTWSPITAVVGVDAAGCAVDLSGGAITCTHASLGLGAVLLPDPHVVFTTSAAFSGTLTNVATVAISGDITDTQPANNVSDPVLVTIVKSGKHKVYLPLILRKESIPAQ